MKNGFSIFSILIALAILVVYFAPKKDLTIKRGTLNSKYKVNNATDSIVDRVATVNPNVVVKYCYNDRFELVDSIDQIRDVYSYYGDIDADYKNLREEKYFNGNNRIVEIYDVNNKKLLFLFSDSILKDKIGLRFYNQSDRLTKLICLYGYNDAYRIFNKEVWIGMDLLMAKQSWGSPIRANKTYTANSETIQWAYPDNKWLYFEDGFLKTIQD